jgi:hypothetical protein
MKQIRYLRAIAFTGGKNKVQKDQMNQHLFEKAVIFLSF